MASTRKSPRQSYDGSADIAVTVIQFGKLERMDMKVTGIDISDGGMGIRADVPLAEMISYAPVLRSITQGRGSFTMELAHYEEVPRPIQEKLTADHARSRKAEVAEE